MEGSAVKVNADHMRRVHTVDLNKLGSCLRETEKWCKSAIGNHLGADSVFENLRERFNQVASNQNIANLLSTEGSNDLNPLPENVKVSFIESNDNGDIARSEGLKNV